MTTKIITRKFLLNALYRICMISVLVLSGVFVQANVQANAQTKEPLNAQQQAALISLFAAFEGNGAAARSAIDDAIILRTAELLHQDDSLPTFGDGSAALVVEFSDYQCGYCKRMLSILRDADVRVKVVEFPVLGELSSQAARYALAANKQGLYEPFHIMMMERSGSLTEEALEEVAAEVGLDIAQLKVDAESAEISAALARNYQFAKMLSVSGTPFFLVNGRPLRGAVDAETFNGLIAQ